MRLPAIAFLLLLSGLAPAQRQCFETHAGEPLNTRTVTGGPNLLLGMKLTAPATLSIEAAQVKTGLQRGPATFQLWSHDAANDRPGRPLGPAGSYQQSSVVTWQGAKFPPVSSTSGQVFWLVWGMPSSSRMPWSTSSTGTVEYRGSFDGGQSWNGANNGQSPWPAKPIKIRLFCTHPAAGFQTLGQGKPGLGGVVPRLVVHGWPVNGNELGILLEQAAPATPAVLAVGVPQSRPLGALGTLHVAPPLVVVPVMTGPGRTPGSGDALIELALPPVTSTGFPLAAQWWIVDSAAVSGLAHTAGASAVIG